MSRRDAVACFTMDAFASAILIPDLPKPPSGVVNPLGGSAVRRYNVYRNNVAVGLKAALADIFPVTRNLVGERFFDAMTLAYIREQPPKSPVLAEYGHGFPDFVAAFEPARTLFYLKDVAALERAWLDAYHARDCPPMPAQDLLAHDPDTLMALRLDMHPAASLLRFDSAAASIFMNVKNGEGLEGVDPSVAESVLIARPQYDVAVYRLCGADAAFFKALLTGHTIGLSAEMAQRVDEGFDLSGAFSLLITSGAFISAGTGGAA